MTKDELLQELILLGAFLCPEYGGHWSVHSTFGSDGKPDFFGWGESPEEAIEDAKKKHEVLYGGRDDGKTH